MGWICTPSDDNCIVRFYSISDDIANMVDVMLQFLSNVAPGFYIMIALVVMAIIILTLFYSVKNYARHIAKNG